MIELTKEEMKKEFDLSFSDLTNRVTWDELEIGYNGEMINHALPKKRTIVMRELQIEYFNEYPEKLDNFIISY